MKQYKKMIIKYIIRSTTNIKIYFQAMKSKYKKTTSGAI